MKTYNTTKNTMSQVIERVQARTAQTPWIALCGEVEGRNYDKVTLSKLLHKCLPKDDWSGKDADLDGLLKILLSATEKVNTV